MALSSKKLAKIKEDYCAGILSKSGVAQKYRISRNTLAKHAKAGGWKYAVNEQEVTMLISDKARERIVNEVVDKATEVTTNFLKDIELCRGLMLSSASDLIHAQEEADEEAKDGKKGKVQKEEYERILSKMKVLKYIVENLKAGYEGGRKALGLDTEQDIEKARKIKNNEKQQVSDPVEGMTEEDIDKSLKKLEG